MQRRCFQLALAVLSAPLQLRRGPMAHFSPGSFSLLKASFRLKALGLRRLP